MPLGGMCGQARSVRAPADAREIPLSSPPGEVSSRLRDQVDT